LWLQERGDFGNTNTFQKISTGVTYLNLNYAKDSKISKVCGGSAGKKERGMVYCLSAKGGKSLAKKRIPEGACKFLLACHCSKKQKGVIWVEGERAV